MKHFSNQSNGSHVGRMNYGGAKFCRFALFPLMLLMLLLLPGRMVAQTDYDESVTFTALAGNPVGYTGKTDETYKNLFDGKKKEGDFSKWCCEFSGSAYVILEASKAGIPVGYIITTGNDNANPKCGGRNPLSWKLYGNNEGKEGAWTLIDKVENDKVLQDKNYASYNFDCKCSTSYQYFKWEISAIHSGSLLQVGEFELKLKTCTHLKADGSSALGAAIKTVEPTCTEHGYTTKECSLCHLIVKEYLNLKPHTLTRHALKAATCTEAGIIEYWQCNVCNKLFSNEAATTEITDAANLVIPANGHTLDSEGNCTVCGANRYALFNNLDGITDVTITDNGSYPWQMLDSNAEGMQDLGFTIPKGSNGLMSGNYRVDSSSSETVIRFKVSKTILLTSQVIISAEEIGGDEFGDAFSIYLDDKLNLEMRGKKQTEYKVLLSPGEHSLKLKYEKGYSSYGNADRAFLYNLKTPVTIDDYVADYESSNNTLTFKKITSNNIESLDLNHAVIVYNNRTVPDICYLLGIDDPDIKSVVFDKSFDTYAPTSLKKFFQLLTGLETIKDLKYLNTENVTDMSSMFWACYALTSLDLSNFNTTNVTNMKEMFYNCKKLTSLDLSNFTTTNVTNMGGMFSSCSALTSLDLSNFYTKVVWWMDNMFNGCSALTTIYASDKFVTDYVHYGGNVFKGCTNLKGYDLSKTNYTYANCGTEGYFTPVFEYAEFDGGTGTLTFRHGLSKPEEAYALNLGESEPGWLTHNKEIKEVVFDASFANARPTGSYMWFYKCTNLATIEGFENLNTENMTKMSYMFFLCRNLSSLDLTNFNTGNVTEMWGMFEGCEGLTSLDLTSFNTANVTDMNAMFRGCSTLTTIYASEKFVTDQGRGYDMFSGCTSLKGYSNSMRDHNYANYKTGYFTKLVGKNGDEKIGATGETLATDNLVLDDDKDFVAYEPFAAKAASYSRPVKAGTTWATLCLPFEVSLANQNFRAFKLLSADDAAETVELEEIETSIAAGTPVIIKMKDGATKLNFTVADKEIAEDVQTAETADANYKLQGIYTKKEFSKDTDNNCYIVKGAKLMNPAKLLDKTTTESVGSKPFRAYMVDNSSAPAAGARMFSISVGGSTTAIEQLETTADSKAEYYDLQGRRLQDLQKGINIVKRGGKTMKVIIK
ncbi:BspA family leucine-rich repeat surface protein [Segatella copri]|uniref:BspA family leucine-rich repeat surface protein n=1 Tax=Segatella copri TaxID=165179 RepID=UPI00294B692B|nr:BspA family leucine-rich repeat surface protein [Segatella copri]